MLILRTIADLRSQVAAWRAEGLSVGFVPTMGALHQGHLSLVTRSNALADRTLVSIFVNPIQFDRADDYARYPRTEPDDVAKLEAAGGCDAVFSPAVEEMFPDGRPPQGAFATQVSVEALSNRLCGLHRPGHFTGMSTLVMKLLMTAMPDVAVFGEKDYQQLQIIRRMVRDLNVPVTIESGATVREPDGLAMSSRNTYLNPTERTVAPRLFEALTVGARRIQDGEPVPDVLAWAEAFLVEAGFKSVDYITLVATDTLASLEVLNGPARLVAAAWLGPARLIDNIPVAPSIRGR
jgi:pantoate--beta-alanine ligase